MCIRYKSKIHPPVLWRSPPLSASSHGRNNIDSHSLCFFPLVFGPFFLELEGLVRGAVAEEARGCCGAPQMVWDADMSVSVGEGWRFRLLLIPTYRPFLQVCVPTVQALFGRRPLFSHRFVARATLAFGSVFWLLF